MKSRKDKRLPNPNDKRGRPRGALGPQKRQQIIMQIRTRDDIVKRLIAQGIPVDSIFTGNAHQGLMSIYANELFPLELRIEAMKACMRYEVQPLLPVDPRGGSKRPIVIVCADGDEDI